MRNKIESYLGFAKKSGNLVTGANTCEITMKKGKLKLLIVTEDTSENSKEKISRLAEKYNIPYRIYGASDNLSPITGSQGRCIFGITDENFAQTIAKEIEVEKSTEKEGF